MPSGPWPNEPKLKGSAARGISFQKKVHKHLAPLEAQGTLYESQWIRFTDAHGDHWCQIDSMLEARDRIIIVEAKLSLRRLAAALTQLQKLYRPTVELIFGKPALMLVAFKYWVPDAELELIDDPEELFCFSPARRPGPFGWHLLH